MKIYIQARGSYETLLNLSSWAEQNEVERIGLPDHYIVGKQRHDKDNPAPALDLLTASAGLVRDTEKMIYSILVSPITFRHCLLYTSPSPRDGLLSRMPSSA